MRSIRRGFTLVEMLAVMAVFSVTLSTIVLTLHALQKAGEPRARQHGCGCRTRSLRHAAPLGCPCRSDVHFEPD